MRCCPICRHELGNIRCLALERVAESLELPCKYQILGCQDIFPYHGRLRHEQNCRFRPYKCPYAGADCPVSGSIPFLVDHLKRDHNVDMHDGCTFNHRYVKSNPQDVENATWMLTVSAFPTPPALLPAHINESRHNSNSCAGFQLLRLPVLLALRGFQSRNGARVHGIHSFHGR